MAAGRKTGGRVKGTPNKATRDIKALAQKHGPEAIATLVGVMHGSESDAARVNAAKELIERGYGKASQIVEHSGTVSIAHVLETARQRLRLARAG